VEPRGLSPRLTMLLYPLTRRSPDHAIWTIFWNFPGELPRIPILPRTSVNRGKYAPLVGGRSDPPMHYPPTRSLYTTFEREGLRDGDPFGISGCHLNARGGLGGAKS
jgi:hypothetical protein